MHRSRLPVLHPCSERWDAMTGDATRRHCTACDRQVLDLSAMPMQAAVEALNARTGRTCVRYRHDAAGNIQFAPPPPPRRPAIVAALVLAACAGWENEPESTPPDELGMCTPEQELAGACEPALPTPQPPRPGTREPEDPSPGCDLPTSSPPPPVAPVPAAFDESKYHEVTMGDIEDPLREPRRHGDTMSDVPSEGLAKSTNSEKRLNAQARREKRRAALRKWWTGA